MVNSNRKISLNNQKLLIPVLVLTVLARLFWQFYPSMVSCLVFWAVGFTLCVRGLILFNKLQRMLSLIFFLGLFSNATVTLANAGFMPSEGSTISIWATNAEAHNLLFLSDRFGAFSIGDILIASGCLLILIFSLVKNWVDKNKSAASEDKLKDLT